MAAGAVGLLFAPGTGRPCSPPMCTGGYFLPSEGTAPASIPAIYWVPLTGSSSPAVEASHVEILRLSGTDEIPVDFTLEEDAGYGYLLRPTEPLMPGSDYRLQGQNLCVEADPHTALFAAGESAPLPASLGTLTADEPVLGEITVATWSGSCSSPITAAYVTVELAFTDDAAPWEDVFYYGTTVDGNPWQPTHTLAGGFTPGGSWAGRGRDMVFVLCATEDPGVLTGVEEGVHQVQMFAAVPGTETEVASNTIEIGLYCDAPPAEGDDTQEPQVEVPDGADEGADAQSDAAPDGDGQVSSSDEAGCGCSVVR